MERLQNHIGWAVIVSQTTHVFCCGLPMLVSLLSLLSGFGLIGMLPPSMSEIHTLLHEWEPLILVISGSVLLLGWGLDVYSRKLDCATTSCAHGPCGSKKKKSAYVLCGATLLFAINIAFYIFSGH